MIKRDLRIQLLNVRLTKKGIIGCFILLVYIFLAGCNPREFPVFKRLSEEKEKAVTESTEKAIKNDPQLQHLDEMCRQVPLPPDSRFVRKGGLDDEKLSLSIYYFSDAPYESARNAWEQYFSQTGWMLFEHRDRGFLKTTEFRNSSYRVVIQYGGMGEGINYAVGCEKL